MQHELLLLLSGHPSPLLSTSSNGASSSTALHLHPGEQESIQRLSQLPQLHTRIRSFCSPTAPPYKARRVDAGQRATTTELQPTTSLSTLRSLLHTHILQPYTSSILKLEREILAGQVGAGAGGLPLSFMLGEMSPWEGQLRGVGRMLDDLEKGVEVLEEQEQGQGAPRRDGKGRRVGFAEPSSSISDAPEPAQEVKRWTSSPLLTLLHRHASTGDPSLGSLLLHAISALEKVWLTSFREFVIWGRSEGVEALVTVQAEDEGIKYAFPAEQLPFLPTLSTPQTRAALLVSFRAICQALEVLHTLPSPSSSSTAYGKLTLGARGRKEGAQLPKKLRDELEAKLEGCKGPGEEMFGTRVAAISSLLSTHLLSTHLPPSLLLSSLTDLSSFYLLRLGSFSSNLLGELEVLRTRGGRGAGREGARRVGAVDEKGLEEAMRRARAGTELEDLDADASDPLDFFSLSLPSSSTDQEQNHFLSRLLGISLSLDYTPPTPALGLLVDEESLRAYRACWGMLMSVKGAQGRVGSCWATLSHTTRLSSSSSLPSFRPSPTDAQTRHALQSLQRSTWALVRQALWLLDSLVGHFMGAVVEGAWSGLKARLGEANRVRREGAEEDPASPTTPSSTITSPPLDFTTLQSLHTLYLSLLQTGLLLTHDELQASLVGLLETCEEVCRVVGGWSSDVLVGAGRGEDEEEVLEERQAMVHEMSQTFHAQLAEFFEALSTASTNPRRTTASSTSFSTTATSFALPRSSFASTSARSSSRANQQHPLLAVARTEAEMMSREFLPQLLLRLDFGRWFSRGGTEEGDGAGDVLGGLRG